MDARAWTMVLATALAGCGGAAANDTAVDLMAKVDQARLGADLATVAHERVPGSPHWQEVQDLCKTRLTEAGFQVELVPYATGVNVIGRRPGTSGEPGDVIVSAHYDHIAGCDGADDNASGLVATLEIARVLGSASFSHDLVIACWDEEERGLIGSRAYADAAKARGDVVRAMYSFDGIGFASSEPGSQTLPAGFDILFPVEVTAIHDNDDRGDFVALIGDQASAPINKAFTTHAGEVALPTTTAKVPDGLLLAEETGDLRRSDHASFWANGYPGTIVTDTANFRNPNYHCEHGADEPSTLDLAFLTKVTKATLGAAFDALNAP